MRKVLDFPANYRLLEDTDGLPRVSPFSPDGLAVGIGAKHRSFALVLPFGDGQYGSTLFLATTPDPDALVVGAMGAAYLVDLKEPVEIIDLGCYAASACAAFPSTGALIVVDLTRMICLDERGVAWTSSELSDDAIRFVGQDADRIALSTYSAADGDWSTRRFLVSPDHPV